MNYEHRMMAAIAGSVLLHVLALALSGMADLRRGHGPGPVPEPPLVVRLQAAEPEPPRRLVESAAPAERPVAETDLISDRNSNAQDPQEDVEGKVKAPLAAEPSEDFELGGTIAKAESPSPPAPPQPEPKEPAKKAQEERKPAKAKAEEEVKPVAPKAPAKPDKPVAVAKAETAGPPKPAPDPTQDEAEPGEAAREQVAQAPRPGLLPRMNPGKFRGSVEGGVKGKGVLGFEAMEHELGPYMLEVRRRVERKWNMAMGLTYTGTTPTKAVVDCVIAPDGNLVKAEVVTPGGSPTFAPLCKQSIEEAAPFPPFPFKVPDIYREKNLEIRWTFNFL